MDRGGYPGSTVREGWRGRDLALRLPAYGSCLLSLEPGTEPAHALNDDQAVYREDEALTAYVRKAGLYTFSLDHDPEVQVEVWDDAPPEIVLDRWHLAVERRDRWADRAAAHGFGGAGDWRDIAGLRYCSGKGTYTTHVELGESTLRDGVRVTLDLGRVHDAAVVEVNWTTLDPLLVYPYAVDVTPAWLPVRTRS